MKLDKKRTMQGMGMPIEIVVADQTLQRRAIIWLVIFAAIAWITPAYRSDGPIWSLYDAVASYVPSIEKAANVSPIAPIAFGYLAASFALLPIAVLNLLRAGAVGARWRYAFVRKGQNGLAKAFVIYGICIPSFAFVYGICMILPFDVSIQPGSTRGQALFSLMLSSRLGLSLIGAILFSGLATLGWVAAVALVGPFCTLMGGGKND